MKVKCNKCQVAIDTTIYDGYCKHEYDNGVIEYFCEDCDNELYIQDHYELNGSRRD